MNSADNSVADDLAHLTRLAVEAVMRSFERFLADEIKPAEGQSEVDVLNGLLTAHQRLASLVRDVPAIDVARPSAKAPVPGIPRPSTAYTRPSTRR